MRAPGLELQRRLSVVVRAFNEENGVAKSVQSLRDGLPGAVVLVVDDGSTDQTADRTRVAGGCAGCLAILRDGFSASLTTTMLLVARGYPTAFHPIETAPRVGTSKVVAADGFRAVILVLRTVMLSAPLRIILTTGLVLLIA